ncbi:MAG TPA: helix-turn-helix domain-containing protein [Ignavibacteriaceae bacterium]|jgi:sugar-specific transcriptional regulator TrmB|nr:helix-turn-helix domain-containing protein [Ignavibacteriaceae bacterium]
MNGLIDKLQKIGLSKRESEVYIALLTKNEFTAPEIGKITSVSRNKSYEVLQSLVKKNLCTEKYKNGTKVFIGIKPDIALRNIISVYENELKEKKELTAKFSEELMKLHTANKQSSGSLDYIEVFTDIGQVRERWEGIERNTKKELLVFTKPPYSVSLEETLEVAKEVKKNKISIKSIYEFTTLRSAEEAENLLRMIDVYKKMGEEARIIEELPMKLAISDLNTTVFVLEDKVSMQGGMTTMIVEHPAFAIALKKVFDSYWKEALTVDVFRKNLKKYFKK